MLRRLLGPLALTIALLAAVPSTAATIIARGVPWLARQADAVVHADVVEVRSQVDEGGQVATHTSLRVRDAWKGPTGGRLTLTQAGGKHPDGRVVRIAGDALLRPGDEVVLFLARHDARWYPLLLGWSVFHVVREAGEVRVVRRTDGLSLVDFDDTGRLAPVDPDDIPAPGTLDALRREVLH